MTAKGHVILASALAYAPLNYMMSIYSFEKVIVSYVIIILSALLPDIDEPKSFIGNKATFLAYFLKMLGLKHRSLTHWFITPSLIAVCGYFLQNDLASLVLYSMAFGILAHDIGDLLTNGGINGFFFPFFPNSKIVLLPRVLRFETFSLTERFFIVFLMGLNVYFYSKLMSMLMV